MDLERLKQRCERADAAETPCEMVMDTRDARELIAGYERADMLIARLKRLKAVFDATTEDIREMSASEFKVTKGATIPLEQFDLLLAGTSIRSEALINALRDHLVHGHTAQVAWSKHGINPSQFSRRLSVIQAESERAQELSKFYQKG